MSKKILRLVAMVLVISMAFVACGSNTTGDKDNNNNTNTDNKDNKDKGKDAK